MITGHGGNRQALADRLGWPVDRIVDLSSNLNPLGPPGFIRQALESGMDAVQALPEPDAAGLCRGFARYHGLDAARVVAANGTTWFLYTLALAFKARSALILGPTYSDYRDGCRMHGTRIRQVFTRAADRFIPDLEALAGPAGKADLVFICNPNNPTGRLIPKQGILELVARCPDSLFVVDESYLPFVRHAESLSLVTEDRFDNLMVLSSMSKIFRIPGLRTGFLSGPAARIEAVMAYYQPWSVNALAQAVVGQAFEQPDRVQSFYEKTRDYVIRQKAVFFSNLEGVDGITLFESAAYFLLARLAPPFSSDAFCRKIGAQGILIRDCSNFDGLTSEFVRFSLKDEKTNAILAGHIRSILEQS